MDAEELKLERERLRQDVTLRREEQKLERERFRAEQHTQKGWRVVLTPAGAAVVAGLVGLFATAAGKFADLRIAQNSKTLDQQIERESKAAELEIERKRAETTVILKASEVTGTSDNASIVEQRARNLLWFADAGYITLPKPFLDKLRVDGNIKSGQVPPAPVVASSNGPFLPTDPRSGFIETDTLRVSSGSGDGDDVKVDRFALLPPGTVLDTSYQQTTINALSGRDAETPLAAVDIPPGFYIECRGDTDNGKRWAVRPPYSGPILSEQPTGNGQGLTQYKFTLGIYADAGHHGFAMGSTGGCEVVVRVFYKPLKK